MASPIANEFTSRLQEAERSGIGDRLAELFADDAELSNLVRHEPARGGDGARRFWGDYLKAFAKVRSRFTNVIEADGSVVLEWVSEGSLPDGSPLSYRGVSVLEVAGDRVRRFRTYYDTAAFVTAPATTDGRRGN